MYDRYLLSAVIVILAFKIALLMEKLLELSLTVTTERPQIYQGYTDRAFQLKIAGDPMLVCHSFTACSPNRPITF